MQYTVVSSAEFTYPDIFEYPSSSRSADVFSARGARASFQLLFRGLDSPSVSAEFGGLPEGVTPELYSLRSVMVERNHGIPDDAHKPHWPERDAPYRLYDCLRTYDGTVDVEGDAKQGGMYIALKISPDAVPGEYAFTVTAGGCEIPGKLQIYSARLPE